MELLSLPEELSGLGGVRSVSIALVVIIIVVVVIIMIVVAGMVAGITVAIIPGTSCTIRAVGGA